MSFPSPEEIAAKAVNAYPRFLATWIRGDHEGFFPYRVRTRLAPDPKAPQETISTCEKLISKSKSQRGWGYTVHRQRIRSRDFGSNLFPTAITVDTLDDLLRLTQKTDEFQATEIVAARIRGQFPNLEDWLIKSVRSLSKFANSMDGLISVAQYIVDHPWPNCYARQIPLPVDTKFVERNRTVLRQWLDVLLPDSAIDVNEDKFARRFGLRDGEPHRGIRLLDPSLVSEVLIPFGELSLPMRSIAELKVKDTTVFIVENDLNLVTMPHFPRGLGLRGEGDAVIRLERLKWLADNRVIYWGDLDVAGFWILSRLRNLFPHVESIMMNRQVIEHHQLFAVPGNDTSPVCPTNLTESERVTYEFCLRNNLRLEQERILQPFVNQVFEQLLVNESPL